MRRGRRGGDRFAEVFVLTSTVGRSRIGIVTPRHGRTAVARNRVRRRLSEIARCRLLPALESKRLHVDLIVRAKPAAYETSYRMLQASLTHSLEFVCAR